MYLLDTNILSSFIKRKPNQNLIARLKDVPSENLYTSCITVMELRYGAMLTDKPELFWRRIKKDILSRIEILDFTGKSAILTGELLALLKKQGNIISIEDIMIAAIAISQNLILVTDNIRHLNRIPNLKIENWLKYVP